LINGIYDLLYQQGLDNHTNPVGLHTNCELTDLKTKDQKITASFLHKELNEPFDILTDAVILATGYKEQIPAFINGIKDIILLSSEGNYRANRNYSIDKNNSIFIQNGEMKTHGFNAPDLSLGPYRNAVIINTILGYEHYSIEKNTGFQTFGLP